MSNQPSSCPKCQSENIYEDGSLWICPECSFEWNAQALAAETAKEADSKLRLNRNQCGEKC
jgi:protein PhnA